MSNEPLRRGPGDRIRCQAPFDVAVEPIGAFVRGDAPPNLVQDGYQGW